MRNVDVRVAALALVAVLTSSGVAAAVEYRFCVGCNNRIGHVLVKTGNVDLGKEWYRVQVSQRYAQAYGSSSCGASDFDPAYCGSRPQEELDYWTASGDQLQDLVSGDPARTGGAAVGIVTGAGSDAVDAVKDIFGW